MKISRSIFLGVLLFAFQATAADVYINGQPLGNLKGISLPNCTVNIDNYGGVNIFAPGFTMPGAPPTSSSIPHPAVTPAPAPVAPIAQPSPLPASTAIPALTSSSATVPTTSGDGEGLAMITQDAPELAGQPAPQPITQQAFVIATSAAQGETLPLVFQFYANGSLSHTFTAAETGRFFDITGFLKRGQNHCKITVRRDNSYRHGKNYGVENGFTVRIQAGNAMHGQFRPSQTLLEISRTGAQLTETDQEFILTY